MTSIANIKPTEKPLEKNALDELISRSGYKVDMILKYSKNEGGKYFIFVKYNQGQVVRQVYTQRNTPRAFKDFKRALDWGKRIGFNSVSMSLSFEDYELCD